MKFSKLSELDKKELIKEIENIKLIYRDKLSFSTRIKFGIEIEYGNAKRSEIKESIGDLSGEGLDYKSYYRWQYNDECDFSYYKDKEHYGGEIASPILKNKKEYFEQIKYACEVLKENVAVIDDRMGFHIHVADEVLKSRLKYLKRFLEIYMLYEDIIYKFGFYGQKPRNAIMTFAGPVSLRIHDTLLTKRYTSYEELYKELKFLNKSKSLSMGEYKPTFEFRNCNGTINPIIIQNNINLFCNLLEASTSKRIDVDYINYNIKKFKDSVYTREVTPKDIDRAIEFADIIFKNDLDKKYFLKQYIM